MLELKGPVSSNDIDRTRNKRIKGRVLIQVHAGNTAAVNLYTSIGFERLAPPGQSENEGDIEVSEKDVWMAYTL